MGYKSSGIVLAEKPSIGVEPTRLYDASRFKNHGVHTNVTMVRLPSGLWVREFNGVDSVITLTHSASLNIIGNLTLMHWVRLDANEDGGLIDKDYTDGGYMLGVFAQTFYLYVNNVNQANSSAKSLAIWYHITGIVNGVANQIYVNAVAGTSQDTDNPTGNTEDLFIGKDLTGGRYPQCTIVLPRISNYALSAGQIKKTFEKERSWFGV